MPSALAAVGSGPPPADDPATMTNRQRLAKAFGRPRAPAAAAATASATTIETPGPAPDRAMAAPAPEPSHTAHTG